MKSLAALKRPPRFAAPRGGACPPWGGPAAAMVLLALCGAAHAEPLACLIEPSQVADIGSPVLGVLERVLIDRGAVVKKGQPLAQVQADVERAAVALAGAKARAQAELQAAQSAHDFARRKQDRTQDLYNKKFISQQALDQTDTEAALADKKIAQAREQQRLAQQELAYAQAQLDQRTIRSPIAGIVVERYLHEGERVDDKPVARVAAVDPLRVEVLVPSALFGRVEPGMVVTVKPELPGTPEVKARVSLVDRVVDTASNSFRVRLELPNPDHALPAGLRCKAEFGLEAPRAALPAVRPALAPAPQPIGPRPAAVPLKPAVVPVAAAR